MKSRPQFCKPLVDESYKAFRRSFYRQEEATRAYLPNLSSYDGRQLSGMTHLEPFSYPVWDVHGICGEMKADPRTEKLSKEQYVLFDYSVKDPLSKEAAILFVDVK